MVDNVCCGMFGVVGCIGGLFVKLEVVVGLLEGVGVLFLFVEEFGEVDLRVVVFEGVLLFERVGVFIEVIGFF